MYKKLLDQKFFDDNFRKGNTAQFIIFNSILQPEIAEMAAQYSKKLTDRAEEEAKEIENEKDVQKLIKCLRGKCDPMNYELLQNKVLEKEDEMLPLMIDTVVNSANDVFVENFAKIIPRCKKNYSKELLAVLDKIKYPYTMSLICLVLGFIGDEDIIPVMMDKFNKLKEQNMYKDDSFEQGPLYALWQLKERFYSNKK